MCCYVLDHGVLRCVVMVLHCGVLYYDVLLGVGSWCVEMCCYVLDHGELNCDVLLCVGSWCVVVL